MGDELRLLTPRGDLRYAVRDTHIVVPTDLSCYPFHYIGAAPKRFIVHAERIFE